MLGDNCFAKKAFEYYSRGSWRSVPSNCQFPRPSEPVTYLCIQAIPIGDLQLGLCWAKVCPDAAILRGPNPALEKCVVLGKR